MDPFIIEKGEIAPLLAANIDTDVIMPKQFLKGIDRKNLDRGVFFDQRFLRSGDLNPEFILNKQGWESSKFLLVGANFGCGSSREHAVWGLKQLGIRALIGTNFAGIFYDNCQRNGVLLIELSASDIKKISSDANNPENNRIEINLPQQTITVSNGLKIPFEIDSLRKNALIEGVDSIGATLLLEKIIDSFEKQYHRNTPWLL